jgi:hypothetical protein
VNLGEAFSCLTNIGCVIKIHNSHVLVHSDEWTSECFGVWMDELIHVRIEVLIYIYIYICVCVCVCGWIMGELVHLRVYLYVYVYIHLEVYMKRQNLRWVSKQRQTKTVLFSSSRNGELLIARIWWGRRRGRTHPSTGWRVEHLQAQSVRGDSIAHRGGVWTHKLHPSTAGAWNGYNTALHIACDYGRDRCVQLLGSGAGLDCTNEEGLTALHVAI